MSSKSSKSGWVNEWMRELGILTGIRSAAAGAGLCLDFRDS